MRVLVTGGAGFVGSHTVDLLLAGDHDVAVLDSLDPQVHGEIDGLPPNLRQHQGNPRFTFIRGDVRDRAVLQSALTGAEAVLHLAAAVGVGQSMYQPFHYCSVNVGGTAQLLDVLATGGTQVRKVVVASSMSIYGEGAYRCGACNAPAAASRGDGQLANRQWEPHCPSCGEALEAIPTKEGKTLAATSIYASSKRSQEELVLCFGSAFRLPVVALRYFNIYGPRQSLANPYTGVAAIFMSRLLNKKPAIVFEDGRQTRDFIHVRDIARANLLALTCSGADYQAVNIGAGRPVSVLQIFEALARVLSMPVEPVVTGQFRAGDIRHCFSDSSLAHGGLGWTPQVDLDAGLRDLVSWSLDPGTTSRDLVDQAYAELDRLHLLR